jgi:iron complex outermembrane receptor protein
MLSTTYEVGAKGTLVKEVGGLGRVGYDVALYWIDVTNDIVPFDGGAFFFTAGKSQRRGWELGLDWTPVTPLTVRGALTVSNNEYVEYENDLGDFNGNEVAGLPSSFADAEVRWRPLPGFSVAGRWKHVDDYFVDDANTASVGPSISSARRSVHEAALVQPCVRSWPWRICR